LIEVWNSHAASQARTRRCPLDCSGNACSAFASIYGELSDYNGFIREYSKAVDTLQSGMTEAPAEQMFQYTLPVVHS
jgi:hypothetical protein